jgi:hypothetical protein
MPATEAFQGFLHKAQSAFSTSVTEVFLISSVLMAMAFIIALFLKEIPLRKTHAEKPGEAAGEELAIEEGVIPAESEPTIL